MTYLLNKEAYDLLTPRMLEKLYEVKVFKENPNRAYFLSYPKVGRTWLRSLIGKYLGLTYKLEENNDLIYLHKKIDRSDVKETIFTHGGYAYNDGPKIVDGIIDDDISDVILLKRNICDTLVSYYYFIKYREYGLIAYEKDISEFLRDEHLGLPNVLAYYNNVYETNRTNIIEITYEDLMLDTEQELVRILNILISDDLNIEHVKQSVDHCLFANMRKMEENGTLGPSYRKLLTDKHYLIREIGYGTYKKHLSKEDIDYVESNVKEFESKHGIKIEEKNS